MIIEYCTKSRLFVASGRVFGHPLVVEADSQSAAFAGFMSLAADVLRRDSLVVSA